MLTGRLPFEGHADEGPNLPALFERIISEPFIMPTNISPDLENLLSLLLNKNPDLRPSAHAVLGHPWTRTIIPRGFKSPLITLPPPPGLSTSPSGVVAKSSSKASMGGGFSRKESGKGGWIGGSAYSPNNSSKKLPMNTVNIAPTRSQSGRGSISSRSILGPTPNVAKTSLIPYLDELFGEELENELNTFGRLHLVGMTEGEKVKKKK